MVTRSGLESSRILAAETADRTMTEPTNAPRDPSGQPLEHAPPPLSTRAKFGGGILTLIWGTVPAIFGTALLFKIGSVAPWLKSHNEEGLLVYVLLFAVFSGLGLLPTYSQAIVGGWAFGLLRGGFGGLVGFVGGATIGYLITKLVAGDGFRAWLDARPRTRVVREAFVESGFWKSFGTVALIRLNSPFALTNLAMSASGVHYVAYALGTAVGLAPRTFVSASIGAAAASQGQPDFQALATKNPFTLVILIVVAIAVAMCLSYGARAALKRAGLLEESTGPKAS